MKLVRCISIAIMTITLIWSCKSPNKITANLQHPFGMVEYNGGLLISNLGKDIDYFSESPNGFITYYKDGKSEIKIKHGGVLFAPKGMAIKDHFLFVADLGKVAVFDLTGDCQLVDQIQIPQADAFVSDVMVLGGTLFISITNYNKIYLLNIENPNKIDHSSLLEYLEVPYPSTIRATGEYVFISSNSFDGTPFDDKIIHIIDNLSSPSLRPIIHTEGDYQAMVFSPEGTRLIFSDMTKNGQIGNIVFETGEYIYETIGADNSQFTSMIIIGNKLFVCDITNSQVLIKDLIEIDGFPNIIKSEENDSK